MRVPITIAPPAPIMLPVPQLPGGDPFDNDLFALSPLHPNNRPLVEMLLKFPQTLLNPATGADQPNGSTECAGNCVLSEKQEKDNKPRAADSIKDRDKLDRQKKARGWSDEQIEEAVERGDRFPATNNQSGAPATRYVHPDTGRSVVIDNKTGGIIHVGGDGFKY